MHKLYLFFNAKLFSSLNYLFIFNVGHNCILKITFQIFRTWLVCTPFGDTQLIHKNVNETQVVVS